MGLKKQFCISERPFGGDSQRDEKMVGRHCSKIQEDGDTEFFPASHQVRRGLEAWGGAGHKGGLSCAQGAPGVLQRG